MIPPGEFRRRVIRKVIAELRMKDGEGVWLAEPRDSILMGKTAG